MTGSKQSPKRPSKLDNHSNHRYDDRPIRFDTNKPATPSAVYDEICEKGELSNSQTSSTADLTVINVAKLQNEPGGENTASRLFVTEDDVAPSESPLHIPMADLEHFDMMRLVGTPRKPSSGYQMWKMLPEGVNADMVFKAEESRCQKRTKGMADPFTTDGARKIRKLETDRARQVPVVISDDEESEEEAEKCAVYSPDFVYNQRHAWSKSNKSSSDVSRVSESDEDDDDDDDDTDSSGGVGLGIYFRKPALITIPKTHVKSPMTPPRSETRYRYAMPPDEADLSWADHTTSNEHENRGKGQLTNATLPYDEWDQSGQRVQLLSASVRRHAEVDDFLDQLFYQTQDTAFEVLKRQEDNTTTAENRSRTNDVEALPQDIGVSTNLTLR